MAEVFFEAQAALIVAFLSSVFLVQVFSHLPPSRTVRTALGSQSIT